MFIVLTKRMSSSTKLAEKENLYLYTEKYTTNKYLVDAINNSREI